MEGKMKARVASAVAVGILIGALVGCASGPSKIQATKAEDYAKHPKRMFVVSAVGTDWGDEYARAFQNKIGALGRECGTAVEVSRVNTLELDEHAQANKMRAFQADSLLTISRNGGTRNQYGLINVVYNLSLRDVAANKLVWRADINFFRGATARPVTERGEALAIEITNKLKDDRILANCPKHALPT
jgi:hypothetical protein